MMESEGASTSYERQHSSSEESLSLTEATVPNNGSHRDRPPGIASFGITPEGQRYATAHTWSRYFQFASDKPVADFIRQHNIRPFTEVMFQGRYFHCYREYDLARLAERRRNACLTTPLGYRTVEPIIESNEIADRIATQEYWIRNVPGINRNSLERSGLQPTILYFRGTKIHFWKQSQIDAVLRKNQERYHGGTTTVSDTGYFSASVRHWSEVFERSFEYLDDNLEGIGVTRLPVPQTADVSPNRSIVTVHAVIAAFEHRQNRYHLITKLTPDPELRTVVGGLEAWSELLDVQSRSVLTHLVATGNTPIEILGRGQAKIYTLEQVQTSWPEAFNQPVLLTRVPGVLIEPYHRQRFLSGFDKSTRKLLQISEMNSRLALNTNGRPVTYYSESDTRKALNQKAASLISAREYLTYVAAVNPYHFRRQALDRALTQARWAEDYQPRILDVQGRVALQGRQLIPRSVVLDSIRRLDDQQQREWLVRQLNSVQPVTLQDVTWPGHWSGKARLWLYDYDAIFNPSISTNTTNLMQNSTDAKVARKDSGQLNERASQRFRQLANAIATEIRFKEIEQRKLSLTDRLQQGNDRATLGRRGILARELERLVQLPEPTKQIGVIDEDQLVTRNGQLVGSPFAWIEKYDREFPDLSITLINQRINQRRMKVYRSKSGRPLVIERDILTLLIELYDARNK